MRVCGMLRGMWTNGIVVAPLLLIFLAARANAFPLQYLPDVPGYIPVYVRYGDQPLEEINPSLAEAFHESPRIRDVSLDKAAAESSNRDLTGRNDIVSLSFKDEIAAYEAAKLPTHQLISVRALEKSEPSLTRAKSPEQNLNVIKMSKYLPLKKNNVRNIK